MSDARAAEAEKLFKKAEAFSRQGAAGDEKNIYDDIAGRFGSAPEPELKKLAAKALEHGTSSHMLKARGSASMWRGGGLGRRFAFGSTSRCFVRVLASMPQIRYVGGSLSA